MAIETVPAPHSEEAEEAPQPSPLQGRKRRLPPGQRMNPWLPETSPKTATEDATSTDTSVAPQRLRRLDFALLALIVVVSLFIRVWDLDKVPLDIMPDEADYLTVNYRTILGRGPEFFKFTFDWSQTAFNNFLQSSFVWLYGFDNSVVGIRMLTVVMSTLAVIPFFFLIHMSFGRWTALFATLLMSSGYWYLNMSRTAWINTHLLLYVLMALLLVELALRATRWRALLFYALAGAFAALCLYGYSAGKVLVLALGLYLAAQWLMALWGKWRERRKQKAEGGGQKAESGKQKAKVTTPHSALRTPHSTDPTAPGELAPRKWLAPPPRPALTFVGSILLAVVMVGLFLPQVPAIIQYWNNYIDRPKAVSIMNVQPPYEGALTMEEIYRNQIQKTYEGWVLMRGLELLNPGIQVRYGPPGEPPVDVITRVLYMVGLPVSLFMLRRSLPWILFWFLGLAITQVLTTGIPDGARATVIIPSVYFFVACSIYWILRGLAFVGGRILAREKPTPAYAALGLQQGRSPSIVPGGGDGVAHAANGNQPFTPFGTGSTQAQTSTTSHRQQAASSKQREAWSPGKRVLRAGLIVAAIICAGLVVYNVRHYWDWMRMPETAGARQPSVEYEEFDEWLYLQLKWARELGDGFTVDHWHGLRREQPYGLVVAYRHSPRWEGPADWLRRGSPVALVEDSPIKGPEPFSVSWKGYLRVPANGEYRFTCVTEAVCEFRVDDKKLLSRDAGGSDSRVLFLSAGNHPIEILYAHRDAGVPPQFSFAWAPPGTAEGPIPIEALAPSRYTP